jgi:hypothetical protein
MVTVTDVSAGITSLKTAFEIAKAMKDISNATEPNSKILDLQGVIMDPQASAIQAREAHSAQIDEIRALEAEIARLKAWDAEKERYELKAVSFRGAMAYMLKPAARGSEPPHWLCPNCYQNGKKGFFQPTGAMLGRDAIYMCASCKGSIAASHKPNWDGIDPG